MHGNPLIGDLFELVFLEQIIEDHPEAVAQFPVTVARKRHFGRQFVIFHDARHAVFQTKHPHAFFGTSLFDHFCARFATACDRRTQKNGIGDVLQHVIDRKHVEPLHVSVNLFLQQTRTDKRRIPTAVAVRRARDRIFLFQKQFAVKIDARRRILDEKADIFLGITEIAVFFEKSARFFVVLPARHHGERNVCRTDGTDLFEPIHKQTENGKVARQPHIKRTLGLIAAQPRALPAREQHCRKFSFADRRRADFGKLFFARRNILHRQARDRFDLAARTHALAQSQRIPVDLGDLPFERGFLRAFRFL